MPNKTPLSFLMKNVFLLSFLLLLPLTGSPIKPNILFILTDDQGYGDLSCNGHPYVKTPHMDKFREESVRLENFHVAPSCSPTRAGLMTGMHEFKSGVTHTKSGPRQTLSKDRITIGEVLKKGGYHTALFNKWHLGSPSPDKRGFDLYVRTASAGPREKMMYWDPSIIVNNQKVSPPLKGKFSPDVITDEVIKHIKEHCAESHPKPFCYFFWTITPHAPVMAPEKYKKRFQGKMSEKEAAYCGMIENIDDNVGRIMECIRELDIEKDTLVILMNDNGATVGLELYNAGMRGPKTTVWPGGTRAFSYWRWKDTLTPRTEEALTGYIDVFPTLAELTASPIPEETTSSLDGHSMASLLKSPEAEFPRDRLLFKHGGRWESGFAEKHKYIQAAVQQGNHLAIRIDADCPCNEGVCSRGRSMKSGSTQPLIYTSKPETAAFHWAITNGWELYNVKDDPSCKKNLASEKTSTLQSLAQAYDTWWENVFPEFMQRGGDAPIIEGPSKKKR